MCLLFADASGQTQMKLSANMVVVGDNINLSCESTMSTLPICYTFYHNDTSFRNITVQQKEAAVVRVANISPSMAGLYYCISDNGIAKQKQLSNMVFLLVVGKYFIIQFIIGLLTLYLNYMYRQNFF